MLTRHLKWYGKQYSDGSMTIKSDQTVEYSFDYTIIIGLFVIGILIFSYKIYQLNRRINGKDITILPFNNNINNNNDKNESYNFIEHIIIQIPTNLGLFRRRNVNNKGRIFEDTNKHLESLKKTV
jgi:hypothetical protein